MVKSIVNTDKLEEISDKIDNLFEGLSKIDLRVVLQDMLRREEWIEQEKRIDKLKEDLFEQLIK